MLILLLGMGRGWTGGVVPLDSTKHQLGLTLFTAPGWELLLCL